jgi:putative sigma-54 modulation protein
MDIRIKSTRLVITPAIKDYIEMKMAAVFRHLGSIKLVNCDVEIEKVAPGQHKGEIFRAEVNLAVPHKLLRVEKTEKDLYKAVDKVKDHLELMIKKHKEKMIDRKKRGK